MGIEIVLKIAGIGMLVAVSCQLLKQTAGTISPCWPP